MNARSLYARLESDRENFLSRARDCALLTIPTLIPPEGNGSHTTYPVPFQGLGARGVNHLSASLLMSLLPPNQPFFRLMLDEEAVRALGDANIVRAEIDKTLSSVERSIQREIEVMAIRPAVFEAMKHLIVAGNVLIHMSPDGMRVHHLDTYVVKRDPSGRIRHIVLKETIAPEFLPDEVLQQIPEESRKSSSLLNDEGMDIYTCLHRGSNGKWEVYQEVSGVIIESTRGSYSDDSLPWFALRMNRVDGESYGRSYVEEYLGDLRSLEGLTQAIVEGSAAAAKVLFLVNPNGVTNPDTLATSPNGAIREGLATDVTVLQVQKQADFSIALQAISTIRERLSYAFLLAESTIRNAERVTAEEVRLTTAAVERQLGGIYSVLSQEFQLPMINRIMETMTRQKRLPKVPKQFVKPLVTTGVDALGRGNDLAKLDTFLVGLMQVLGPEAMQYLNMGEYLNRRAAALGIDTEGLVRTEEEVTQQKMQMLGAQMTEKLGPGVIAQVGKGVSEGTLDPNAIRDSLASTAASLAPPR